MNTGFLGPAVATVLTVYGIETFFSFYKFNHAHYFVATVLTVYGIETYQIYVWHTLFLPCCNSTYRLRY